MNPPEHATKTPAKIMTIGERAEDVFYVSDEQGNALDEDAMARLRDALIQEID